MIPINVKSLWHGQVGIPDKYIDQALRGNEGVTIHCMNGTMVINPNEVRGKIIGKSEKPFHDKFGDHTYYLYYFKWEPEFVQEKLLL